MRKGCVHLYTGYGKGKTSAAVGLCLRAVGRGLKCTFIQFVKGKESGEFLAAKYLPNFEFIKTGRPDYNFVPNEEDKERAERALKIAYKKASEVDLLVLDEVTVAVYLDLLNEEELIKFVKKKPEKLELVLTGRYATKKLVELCDYVTYFQLIKHPFYKGQLARKGIDF